MKESTSLSGLPAKKITAGTKKLQDAGITPARWLAMLDADAASMERLVAAWPGAPEATSPQGKGFVYDAVAILGFGPASAEPLPKAAAGELVTRVGAWSLKDLRTNETAVRRALLWDQDWYDRYPWSEAKLTPGIHRLRMPVPDSNRKTFSEQQKLLLPGEETASACLAVTALLVHLEETGNDLLRGDFARCAEALPGDSRAEICVRGGRVSVGYLRDDVRDGYGWLASSVRKS